MTLDTSINAETKKTVSRRSLSSGEAGSPGKAGHDDVSGIIRGNTSYLCEGVHRVLPLLNNVSAIVRNLYFSFQSMANSLKNLVFVGINCDENFPYHIIATNIVILL